MNYLSDREEKKKAQHPVGFEPTTSMLWGMCSTAVVQQLLLQMDGFEPRISDVIATALPTEPQPKPKQAKQIPCNPQKS